MASDDREADALMSQRLPDLVLLDRTLPGLSGLQFTKRLRSRAATARLPIIMLSAHSAEIDIVEGLDSGVDDYVCKPFSSRELVARMRALMTRLRHKSSAAAAEAVVRRHGRVTLDHDTCRVSVDEESVRLAPIEFKLFAQLIGAPERVYQRETLIARVWDGQEDAVDLRTIDAHVRRLRMSLRGVGLSEAIETVRGVGYRFCRRALEEGRVNRP